MASRASPAAADVGGLIDDDEVGHFFVDGRWVGGAGGEEDYPALSPVGAGSGNASAGARVSGDACVSRGVLRDGGRAPERCEWRPL